MQRLLFAIVALSGLTSANAQESASPPAPAGFTIEPIPPADPRGKFIPPQGGVYVINQRTSEILLCYPDIKEGKYIVICSPPANLGD